MRISIRGGTADHGQPSLCESCRWATVIRGKTQGDEIVECGQLSYRNQRVPFPVVSCSRYSDRSTPSLRDMEDIAWILPSDPHRKQMGFIRSSRLTDGERYVLEEE